MAYLDLDLTLTEQHRQIKAEVHKFAVEALRPAALALDKLPPEKVVEKGSLYWQTMAGMYENGYHTAILAGHPGSLAQDPVALHILWEELAYGSVGFAVALGVSCFCATAAQTTGSPRLIDKFYTPFVNCKDAGIISCWGATEPDHGSDSLMMGTDIYHNKNIAQQCKAVKRGADWIINGQKAAWVSNGPVATNIMLSVNLVPEMGMAGGGACLLDLNQPGVSRGKPLDKLGQRELPQGEIFFDNVVCPGDQMIIDQTAYEMVGEMTLAHANMGMGAFFTGLAQACYDLVLQYTRERVQGGRRLCEHAWIQSRLFDMFSMVEVCRAFSRSVMVYNTKTFPPSPHHSIASKVYSTNCAFKVATEAVQIFGGLGLSKELPIEKLFRDARAGLIEDGTNDTLSIVGGNMLVR
jgi:alkylation response protein AidB-like acyl-CoA dehydrogenase